MEANIAKNISIFCKLSEEEISDEENDYRIIMRSILHTIWHIITGIVACILVLSIKF
jgi:hypothetical protein